MRSFVGYAWPCVCRPPTTTGGTGVAEHEVKEPMCADIIIMMYMHSFHCLAGVCNVLGGTGVFAPDVSYVVLVLSYVPHVYTWSCALWGALC